jgi:hypothetical protein
VDAGTDILPDPIGISSKFRPNPGRCIIVVPARTGLRKYKGGGRAMQKKSWPGLLLAGLCLGLGVLAGCQTWTANRSVPGPRYQEVTQNEKEPAPFAPELPTEQRIAAAVATLGKAAPGQ